MASTVELQVFDALTTNVFVQAIGVVVLSVCIFAAAFVGLGHWRQADISGSRSEIAGFIAGIVGVVATGVLIPHQINADGIARQERANCFESVMALRRTLNQINLNYTVAPHLENQRMADWDTLGAELENAEFGCQSFNFGATTTSGELMRLRSELPAAKRRSGRLDPDREYLDRVAGWTAKVLDGLH